MPNYSLVINSKFRPFEFSELLQPVLLAEQAHRELEDAYSELATKSSVWDKMTNSETDKRAHGMYSAYAKDLEQQAEELAKHGLTPSSRQSMLNMKKRYSTDIVPIEQAYKKREAQIEEQRKALLQNPTLLLSRRADTTSLDAYLDNPQLGYDAYSGALLTQQVGQAAAAIAKELRDYGNGKKLDGFTRTWLQQHGFTASEVAQAINNPNDPKSSNVLNTIVNNVMADSGIANWASEDTLGQAYNYARQGLWGAVGQTQVQTYTDEAARIAANEASQKRVARYAHDLQETPTQPNNRVNPLALRSQQEINSNLDKINRFIKDGFMEEVNGRYVITPLGRKVYASNIKVTEKDLPKGMNPLDRGVTLRGLSAGKDKTDFRVFMDELNGGKPLYDGKSKLNGGKGNFMPTHAGNLFTNAVKYNSKEIYDTYHSTEYDRQLASSYSNEFTKQLWNVARHKNGESVLDVVDFNGKDGWRRLKTLTSADLEGYKVSNVRYSKYGNTAILQKDGKDPIRVELPVGIHLGAEHNIASAISNADDWGVVLDKGKRPMTTVGSNGKLVLAKDAKGNIMFTNNPLTDEDKIVFSHFQDNALNELGSYGSQLVVPSTTSNEEYKPFGF